MDDERIRIAQFAGDSYSILIVKNVKRSDGGEYRCSLPTASGTETSFVTLDVYGSYKLNKYPLEAARHTVMSVCTV